MEEYTILNENGSIQNIGKFEDFDGADDFLNEKNMLAFYVFNEEAFLILKESIKNVLEENPTLTSDDFFILNENNSIESIGKFLNFNDADKFLMENDRDEDSFFLFSSDLFLNLQTSIGGLKSLTYIQ